MTTESTGTVNQHDWLKALLTFGDFAAAELVVNRMAPDFGQIFALTELAKGYYRHGKSEQVRASFERAVVLWREHRDEWWFFMLMSTLLRAMCECGETAMAEQFLAESQPLVEMEPEPWLQTHGWCGLAIGAIHLGRANQGKVFFAKAAQVADGRDTRERQASAWEVVSMNLRAVGWKESYICGVNR